jgi:hypothetical protein
VRVPDATPVGRYVALALISVAGVVAVVLLVRPFIFSFASARDDANYPLIGEAEVTTAPQVRHVVLQSLHGLLGEVPDGELARLNVIVTLLPTQVIAVVNAWSPDHGCAVELGEDRLVDCAGDTWTYAGFPIDPGHGALQVFPSVTRNGEVVVDFTRPTAPQS